MMFVDVQVCGGTARGANFSTILSCLDVNLVT